MATRARAALLDGLVWVVTLALLGAGCMSPRLVALENLEAPLPAPAPASGWRAEMAALLARYQQSPVLAPQDARLDPLFGGLTTLSYFGADAQPRVMDQRIAPSGPAAGRSLDAVCAEPASAAAEIALATSGLPLFMPVWLALSRTGGTATTGARCGEHGEPSDPGANFCAFARVALQREPGRPLIGVVHGMFDSGAQPYVQRLAAVLYRQGYSVLLPDMRDHGDTLRAAPELATTLGVLEGPDLGALVQSARSACGERVGSAGLVGVSGGALDAIRAFTLDQEGQLAAGVIALSPLLDVEAAVRDLNDAGPCPLNRTVELTWQDTLGLTLLSGAGGFAGAALVQALQAEPLNGSTALAAGIAAGAGLLGGLMLDAWFDGGAQPCVAENAIALIVQDALRVRWRTLAAPGLGPTVSPAGRRIAADAVRLTDYIRERVQFRAAALGVRWLAFDPVCLTNDLRTALTASTRRDARLLVIGAEDDPMTRQPALHEFIVRTRAIPQVYARALRHGGHAAFWLVQPAVMEETVHRFFGAIEH